MSQLEDEKTGGVSMIDNIDALANRVVENEQWERTRPEKICVDVAWWSICLAWESDEDDMKRNSNEMKNNRNLRNSLSSRDSSAKNSHRQSLFFMIYSWWILWNDLSKLFLISFFSLSLSLWSFPHVGVITYTFDVFFCYVYCWCHCVPWWEFDSFCLLRIRERERRREVWNGTW